MKTRVWNFDDKEYLVIDTDNPPSRWMVEWSVPLVDIESDSFDPIEDTNCCSVWFSEKEEAIEFAKLPKTIDMDYWKCPRIQEQILARVEGNSWDWMDDGEAFEHDKELQ